MLFDKGLNLEPDLAAAAVEFHTNIAGKVRNTKLPKSKALWPLFETISNSIHAIEEKGDLTKGIINIKIIRNGDPSVLEELSNVESYPIHSIAISDNGIGFNELNYNSFLTAESDYKIEKGAKGVGRFVCLKAFKFLKFKSVFKGKNNILFKREFNLKPIDKGIFNYNLEEVPTEKVGTDVTLHNFISEYQDNCPKLLKEIGEKVIEHFLIYFILKKCPIIQIIDSNKKNILLQDLFSSTFKSKITETSFTVHNQTFDLHLLEFGEISKGHNIYYCANERAVSDDKLKKIIPDLGEYIFSNEKPITYQAYVTGEYFDKNVDTERTSFNFPVGDKEDTDDETSITGVITLKNIRDAAKKEIEVLLDDYLSAARGKKFDNYSTHIFKNAPQFKSIVKYKPEVIKKMAPNLSGNKLNIELFKIQSELELEVKELGEEILNDKNDCRSSEEYVEKYQEYIEKANDVGKANLAKYIVHRKAIIELLDKFLGIDDDELFQTEETIHNIFFPIRSTSDQINYEQQNLWLIDERLSYHSYLASDKQFKEIEIIDEEINQDRPDLLIFNDSFAFVNDEAPHNSFVGSGLKSMMFGFMFITIIKHQVQGC